MDWSPPGASVHENFQARILEWVAISSSKGSSWPRDQTHISCISCITPQQLLSNNRNNQCTHVLVLLLLSGKKGKRMGKWLLSPSLRPGEGNGTPLQYSCLGNPTDGGAWQATVHGVMKSQTRLSNFTFTFHFHALEKEMATHSSIVVWRIPGTGAWWAAVYGVAQSRTRLTWLSSSSSRLRPRVGRGSSLPRTTRFMSGCPSVITNGPHYSPQNVPGLTINYRWVPSLDPAFPLNLCLLQGLFSTSFLRVLIWQVLKEQRGKSNVLSQRQAGFMKSRGQEEIRDCDKR